VEEFYADLLAIDINGIDHQFVTLFQSYGDTAVHGNLFIIVDQDLEELLIRQDTLILGLLEEDRCRALRLDIFNKIPLPHKAHNRI